MRGAVPGLTSPHPLGDTLPGLYADDAFAQALCAGLDEVLAPVVSTMDNLPAYLDLGTAPDDLLPWLSRWVGMSMQAPLPVDKQRELLRSAVAMQGWQGTTRGLHLVLESLFGAYAVVTESGASTWSTDPDAALPGDSTPSVSVRVRPRAGQTLDVDQVEAVVAAVIPAHVLCRVEVEQPVVPGPEN